MFSYSWSESRPVWVSSRGPAGLEDRVGLGVGVTDGRIREGTGNGERGTGSGTGERAKVRGWVVGAEKRG